MSSEIFLGVDMVLCKVAGKYEIPSKTLTAAPKRVKYGLKLSQEGNIDNP